MNFNTEKNKYLSQYICYVAVLEFLAEILIQQLNSFSAGNSWRGQFTQENKTLINSTKHHSISSCVTFQLFSYESSLVFQ